MKYNNVLESIGHTPLIKINKLFPKALEKNIEVWIKLERNNPGGSIKDRIAKAMIEDAEKSGALKKGSVIIEPTSGNTGVGLAMVCAVKGYKLILTMPESMSIERRRLMSIYGAELVLTPREKGMKVFAVEPSDSPVLSGGNPGPHPIQGIGAGFVPKILNRDLLDGIVTVTKDEAYQFARDAARLEGILLGVSSGASLAAVSKKLDEIPNGSKIVTFCYDTGERYLSIEGLF
jgi:cysteine synthase